MIDSVDALRKVRPEWGVCLYGLEPGQPLTLEVHTPDGAIFPFTGMTEAECFAKAFPPPPPEPENDVFG